MTLKQRTDHVFAHPLGFFPGLGPDLAVDREAGVSPAGDFLHQGLRDELLVEEQSEDLAGEELGQEAILEGSEMMKPPLRVFASLGHQEVGMGMKDLYSKILCLEKIKLLESFMPDRS